MFITFYHHNFGYKMKDKPLPQHWYEWGDEDRGMVSTCGYSEETGWVSTGTMRRDEAIKLGLTLYCPYS